jgi:hypothetical protein
MENQKFEEKKTSHENLPGKEVFLGNLFSWEAREYEKCQRHRNWYLIVFACFFGLIIYALFSNNLLMAILFILLGTSLYLFEKKDPAFHKFIITTEGIIAQDDFYEFSTIESFWIFYEPAGKKILSLKNKKGFLPPIHIPLGNADPVEIREILLEFILEEKQDEGLVDLLERFL